MSVGAFIALLVAATLMVGFLTGSVQLVVNVAVSGSIIALVVAIAALLNRVDVIDTIRRTYGQDRASVDELPSIDGGTAAEEAGGAQGEPAASEGSEDQETA